MQEPNLEERTLSINYESNYKKTSHASTKKTSEYTAVPLRHKQVREETPAWYESPLTLIGVVVAGAAIAYFTGYFNGRAKQKKE